MPAERQRRYYDRQAASFDRGGLLGPRGNCCHRGKIARIQRWLAAQPRARVLEVGTGTGIHAAWMLELAPLRYVGIDLSAAMLGVARERLGERVLLAAAAAERLPFASASFDAAYMSGTLHHLADRRGGIEEIARVVKPGGRVAVSEPNPWNPLNALAWITRPLERGQLDMREALLGRWFAGAGLIVDHVEYFNFTPRWPRSWAPRLERLDQRLGRTPVVRRLASMLLVAGRKPG